MPPNVQVTEASNVADWLPARTNGRDVNKGSFGHVLIFAGSSGIVGAPVLVAEAAARAGAGLVTLTVPRDVQPMAMARVSPVVMTRGLTNPGDAYFGQGALSPALAMLDGATVVALGPGIGTGGSEGGEIHDFVSTFVACCHLPMVIDADALVSLAHEPLRGTAIVKSRVAATVLTPHPGEMGGLLGISTHAVQEDRLSAVTKAAQSYGCVVMLKGEKTLIAAADGTVYLNSTGNPGMSTGGSGDVLTGVLAALIAQQLSPLRAAVAGAYVHGLAGDLAGSAQGGATGLLATDVISYLPQAIARCQKSVPFASRFPGQFSGDFGLKRG